MPSESIDLSKKIAIAAYKKHSVEKIGYVEYIENRGVAISPKPTESQGLLGTGNRENAADLQNGLSRLRFPGVPDRVISRAVSED